MTARWNKCANKARGVILRNTFLVCVSKKFSKFRLPQECMRS